MLIPLALKENSCDIVLERGCLAEAGRLLDLPQLRVGRLALDAPRVITRPEDAAFTLYSCVRGGASVQLPLPGGQALDFALRAGETALVPAECAEYRLLPTGRDTLLLETTVEREETDPYINPDAEPVLPEDL